MALTLGGKNAGKFTKAHPQKSRGKQTCTENAKQNAVPDPAGQSAGVPGTNPACLVIFSKEETSNGDRGFFL